ncbi:MAG: hypothetical protein WDN27_04270 [Candidatus Saccharibacteria bacterium]
MVFGDSLSVQPSRPAGASLTLGVTYSANKGGQVGWIEVLDPTTVVLVNQAGNGNTTGATSLSVTITAPTIGNLMILEIASWDGVTSLADTSYQRRRRHHLGAGRQRLRHPK